MYNFIFIPSPIQSLLSYLQSLSISNTVDISKGSLCLNPLHTNIYPNISLTSLLASTINLPIVDIFISPSLILTDDDTLSSFLVSNTNASSTSLLSIMEIYPDVLSIPYDSNLVYHPRVLDHLEYYLSYLINHAYINSLSLSDGVLHGSHEVYRI